jgi:hypothetical protein
VATSHVHIRGADSRIHHLKVPNGDIWHAVVRDDVLGIAMPMDVRFDQGSNAWIWEMGHYRRG